MVKDMVDTLVTIVVGVSLIPIVVDAWTNVDLSNISLGGGEYANYSWITKIALLLFILGVGFLAYKMYKGK